LAMVAALQYGSVEAPSAKKPKNNLRVAVLCGAGAAVGLACVLLAASNFVQTQDAALTLESSPVRTQELVIIKPPPLPVPWSPPDTLYMYWGPLTDKRVNGENVRHIVKLGNIAGGEYRSPKFILDLTGQKFRDLTLTCCNAVLFPPFGSGFPIWPANGKMSHRVSRFVANGNTMIFTGGILSTLFINRIFKYKLEPVQNNYSPGPFIKYQEKKLPKVLQKLPDVYRQAGTQVVLLVFKAHAPSGDGGAQGVAARWDHCRLCLSWRLTLFHHQVVLLQLPCSHTAQIL